MRDLVRSGNSAANSLLLKLFSLDAAVETRLAFNRHIVQLDTLLPEPSAEESADQCLISD